MAGPRALMRAHVAALFTHDARERMLRVNEPEGAPAPRFFLGRTAEGFEWRLRDDVDDELARELEAECEGEPRGGARALSPCDSARYEALLGRVAPVRARWAGPTYCFPRGRPAPPSRAVAVCSGNAEVLRRHLAPWLADAALGRTMWATLVDGRAVSVCCSVRTTSDADEAGVETAAGFRGRGYATSAVSAWARDVERAGRAPLYSTSWENAASRSLARKLGLVHFGSDLHLT